MRLLTASLLLASCAALPQADPQPDGVDPALLQVGEDSLVVEVAGSGAPWLVCVAGVGGSLHAFDPLWSELCARGRTLRYSRSGQDGGSYVRGAKDLDGTVDELEAVLEAAGAPERFVLVGHSFGGLICRAFAARHPERVAGLLSIDPTFEDYLQVLDPLVPGARALERGGLDDQDPSPLVDEYESLFEVWDSPERWGAWFTPAAPAPHVVLTSTRIGAHPLRGSEAIMRARLEAQARTLAGSTDPVQLTTADAGHLIQRERPDQVLEALDLLLSRVAVREAR